MGMIVNKTYEIIGPLGQGGMGEVFKARHIHFNNFVALKRLWPELARNPKLIGEFKDEAITTYRLKHENIVEVRDFIESDDGYYIVMDYVEGRSLAELIHVETGAVIIERAVTLFEQILSAIAYIHSQSPKLIHRDIKPQNILVTPDNKIKVADFGIAKILQDTDLQSTVMKGTPFYMSPEQIKTPKSVDTRTDVYSLGMTFYEMICGRLPFDKTSITTPTAVHDEIINDRVPPPDKFYRGIPEEYIRFTMQAIHKNRELRFADANEMLSSFRAIKSQSGDPTITEPIPPPGPDVTTVRENPARDKFMKSFMTGAFVFLLFCLLLTGVAYLYGLFGKPADPQPPVTDPVKMVEVQAGNFLMGCTDEQQDCEANEMPVHRAHVGTFMISTTEVTQALWKKVMKNNPSTEKGDSLPVESVSWFDAVEFCNRLSEMQNLEKAYTGSGADLACNLYSTGYRLPTETEWEFAARGGNNSNKTIYSGSNNVENVAWYKENSGGKLKVVGTKSPNELGIYDMSGNVWEWCWDYFYKYNSLEFTNPGGPGAGDRKILRGGSWYYSKKGCRVSHRSSNKPDKKGTSIGFRIVRSVSAK